MQSVDEDEAREYRISMEAIVDAYGPEEHAMGWYYYLEGKIQFPFQVRCITERRISPLKGEQARATRMAPEDECEHEMFVEVEWKRRKLAVPLAQLEAVNVDDEDTLEAIADWHYWVARGYEF